MEPLPDPVPQPAEAPAAERFPSLPGDTLTAHRTTFPGAEALREGGGTQTGEALFRTPAASSEQEAPAPSALPDAVLAEQVARHLLAGLRRASHVR